MPTSSMSQDLFSFQQLLIGLLRLSSSHQSVWDPDEISRFLHQITGLEFCLAPAHSASGTLSLENIPGKESPDVSATIQHPDLSPTYPASQTTMTIDEIGTQKSLSTTKNIEEIFTQQAESTAHYISATTLNLQQDTTNHASSNEDNNSSYFSCVCDWHMSRGLFNQDDLDRFLPHTSVSLLYMTLLSNRPGHGLLIVTRKILLTFAVWVILFAQWMAASMSVTLYYLMTKDKRTVLRNLVGVDYVLLTNAPLLTCLVKLIVL